MLALTGCTTTKFIDRTRTVEVPVKVFQPLPAQLTKDCAPEPTRGTTVAAIFDRASKLDRALAACRCQLAQIRGEKESPLCQ
jgi:hypothetical protein